MYVELTCCVTIICTRKKSSLKLSCCAFLFFSTPLGILGNSAIALILGLRHKVIMHF